MNEVEISLTGMDYFLVHGKDIMFLCFGFSTLILAVVIARAVWMAVRLMRKIDSLTDIVIDYLYKPLKFVHTIEKFLRKKFE